MRSALAISLLFAAAGSAACGPANSAGDRVSVLGVDRLSGELSAVEVDLPGVDLTAVRGPAGVFSQGGAAPDCAVRRKVSGALVARTVRCVTLLGQYAAMDRARQFLLSAGAEALPPAPVAADSEVPGLHYLSTIDAFTLGDGPRSARVPAAYNPGAVVRELSRRQLRSLAESHAEDAEGIALFLGAVASSDPGYLASSDPAGDPAGDLDLARPLPAGAPASAALAGALWAWADATGDLVSAARAVLAASRAVDRGAPVGILSLVIAQLDGVERDQACAVFRARASRIPACP